MKEIKLVIDDSSIDSLIEKVCLLKDDLASLGLSVNLLDTKTGVLKPV